MAEITIDRLHGKGDHADYKVEIDTSEDPVLLEITDRHGKTTRTRLTELIEGCGFLDLEVYKEKSGTEGDSS